MDQFLLGKPLDKNSFFKSFPKIRSDGEFGFDLKNPDKVQFYGFNNSDLDFPPKNAPFVSTSHPYGQRGEFHISHDASRLISGFSPRWKERSRVSREILNDLNFKMQLI